MNQQIPASNNQILLKTERFSVEEVQRILSDGTIRNRAVIRHPGAVVILPLVGHDHVCLIRNFRAAVGRELIELPAGTLTPGENPLAAAQRELSEETGYVGGSWELMQTFFPSPGILDERMVLYRASELTPGPPAREHGEEIENLVVPWDEALRMIRDGKIEDAKTLAGLLLEDQRRRGW
jgi:ADP-ribose pyrophosphatase